MRTALEQGGVVGAIAGISALTAISATNGDLPTLMNIYTAGLAAGLAGLVRYATIREIPIQAEETVATRTLKKP